MSKFEKQNFCDLTNASQTIGPKLLQRATTLKEKIR